MATMVDGGGRKRLRSIETTTKVCEWWRAEGDDGGDWIERDGVEGREAVQIVKLGILFYTYYAVSYPTPKRLAEELTGGTVSIWPVDGAFILAQESTTLTPLDTVGLTPRVILLSMRLFQGARFLDVAVEFDNAPGGTSTHAALQPALTDRRTVLDAVIRDLRHAASGTTPPPSD
ncbi:flocculation protein FLO11-like [Cucumis melo var. makuwa]|uniref:Flocculation protein FLO11-like n=1 Tax=Cucumis melo var. makuwa TaxID=1194695 RepID=A0A5A7TIR1_CUCMM|nr:flocculation protein FLO11-like [Cucumis melo var. makuwa]TYK24394.1 flocculation protein FLO11-like [Cucumis melo var. makuwa]